MTAPSPSVLLDLAVGDLVVRRPGTLGNMDDNAAPGRVADIYYRGTHKMLTVKFPTHEENFADDVYVRVRSTDTGGK